MPTLAKAYVAVSATAPLQRLLSSCGRVREVAAGARVSA
jgi:hypothetical protein